MTVRAWRIVKAKHQADAFSGEGARLVGGRWSSRGRRAVYVSATVALATLEMLVHLGNPGVLAAYVLFPVDLPRALITEVEPADLPSDWRRYPAPASLQLLGDGWLDSRKSAALRVPSAIVPSEFNYVINPDPPDFGQVRVSPAVPYSFDPRLVTS